MPKCIGGWMNLPASLPTECVTARNGIIWPALKRCANYGATRRPSPPANILSPTWNWKAGANPNIHFRKMKPITSDWGCFKLQLMSFTTTTPKAYAELPAECCWR